MGALSRVPGRASRQSVSPGEGMHLLSSRLPWDDLGAEGKQGMKCGAGLTSAKYRSGYRSGGVEADLKVQITFLTTYVRQWLEKHVGEQPHFPHLDIQRHAGHRGVSPGVGMRLLSSRLPLDASWRGREMHASNLNLTVQNLRDGREVKGASQAPSPSCRQADRKSTTSAMRQSK